MILLEIQILTDIKGFVLASKYYPKTRHTDGRSRDPLGGLRWDQSLSRIVLLENKNAQGCR